jgi:hypothetical protein
MVSISALAPAVMNRVIANTLITKSRVFFMVPPRPLLLPEASQDGPPALGPGRRMAPFAFQNVIS